VTGLAGRNYEQCRDYLKRQNADLMHIITPDPSAMVMIRAGNDGISAVIGPRGEIVAQAPGFVRYVLHSEVTPRMGLPPYARVGNWLIGSLSAVGVVLGVWLARRSRRKSVGQKGEGTLGRS